MEEKELADYLVGNRKDMYRWAYQLTKNYDDAQDLLQSTMLCALKSRMKYDDSENISGWLYTIMRNTFLNNVRHDDRCCCMEKEELDQIRQLGGEVYYDDIDARSDLKDIHRAINGLENYYKIPFSLYLSGYKYAEIAATMGIPIGTVKSRIYVSRVRLRKELKDFLE